MLQKSDAFKKQIKRTMMNRMYFKEYNSNLLANEKTYFAPVGSSKESMSAKKLPLVISHIEKAINDTILHEIMVKMVRCYLYRQCLFSCKKWFLKHMSYIEKWFCHIPFKEFVCVIFRNNLYFNSIKPGKELQRNCASLDYCLRFALIWPQMTGW